MPPAVFHFSSTQVPASWGQSDRLQVKISLMLYPAALSNLDQAQGIGAAFIAQRIAASQDDPVTLPEKPFCQKHLDPLSDFQVQVIPLLNM